MNEVRFKININHSLYIVENEYQSENVKRLESVNGKLVEGMCDTWKTKKDLVLVYSEIQELLQIYNQGLESMFEFQALNNSRPFHEFRSSNSCIECDFDW